MQWKIDGIRKIPQAFPYQGSKRILMGKILSLFPEGDISELIEPFAGSAAISVCSRYYKLVDKVAISDVNEPLMALWRLIIDAPEDVIEGYAKLWHEQQDDPRAYFVQARATFNDTKDPIYLLYLLCRIVKAAVRYSKSGEFNQGADHRRLGAKPANIQKQIMGASRLMQGATVSVSTYEEPLVNADRYAIVYMDPPYQGTTDVPDHRYLAGLRREAFVSTLATAIDNHVSFIVSYDVVRDDNKYGVALPDELGLLHRNVAAGTSSQATLLGASEVSVESLYLSPALVQRLGGADQVDRRLDLAPALQDMLFSLT